MSHNRAPGSLRSALIVAAGHIALLCPAWAQPYGFFTPVPANSFLRTVSIQSTQGLRSYPLPQAGLVLGLAINSTGTLVYSANNLEAGGGAEVVVTALPSGQTVATIPLVFTPYSLILSPDGTRLYAAGTVNFTTNYLSVIDATSNSVITNFSLNVSPAPTATFPMAITPDGSTLFLAAGGLVRLNTAAMTVASFSSPSSFSQGIAVTPDGTQLWFGLNNTIQVRNAKTLALLTTISATGSSFGGNGLMITPDGTSAILANNGIRVFSTSTFLQTASVSGVPYAGLGYIAPGPDGASFLVTNTTESLVLRVSNSLTLLATYIHSSSATASVSIPGTQTMLTANGNVTAVGTVNTQTGIPGFAISVGCQAGVPTINAARTRLYIPDRCSQDITVVNLGSRPAESFLHLPIFATKVLVSPDESRLYAADLSGIKYPAAGTIAVLDRASGSIIKTFTGAITIDMALSADGSRLYVSDNGTSGGGFSCPIGGVCVFDTSTFALLAQIPNVFGSLALSQDGNSLYVGPGGNSLTVVNTTTFAVSQISLSTSLNSLGSVAISPVGNAAVVIGNTSSGGIGFLLDTSANQITGEFPVPSAFLSSAAFAPNGNSVWFLSGASPSTNLVQESFPAGATVTSAPAQGQWLTFFAPL